MVRTAVFQIIPVDRGHDHMLQAQLRHCMGDPARLEGVQCLRLAGGHVAEGTAPRADLAHDHHGGVTLAPAFADIGAARLFADRDKLLRPDDVARGLVTLAHRGLHPYPVRFFRLRGIGAMRLFGVALVGKFQIAQNDFPADKTLCPK
jgi:hypothetical protein